MGSRRHDFDAIWHDISATLWQAILAYSGGRRDVADDAVAEAFARGDPTRRPGAGPEGLPVRAGRERPNWLDWVA